ncbi:MAG: hypothetical protein IH620_06155 [Ignavibacterium sp.]|nr:hypothetical protein [Ignavibacterium sp.]
MMLNFKFLVFVFIAVSINTYSQVYESIEKSATEYFISLSNKDSDVDSDLSKLKEILFRNFDKTELESKYQTSINDFDSLKNHFNEYESTVKNISKDSALVLFNQWYLHFSNTFYNYADEKFFSSNKTKILFFSASMSCQCTLEMCKKQTIEILNLAKEMNLDYWIVDSYEHNDLQIKYETFFAPSLIVFDSNNNVLYKIEYDEKMIVSLFGYFNNESKKNNLE